MNTRVLLTCAAFSAVGVVLVLIVAPLSGALAPMSPPLYAVLAGVYSLMPVTARRFTGVAGTATLTAVVAAVATMPFTPLGPLALIPLLASAATIDLVLRALSRRGTRQNTVAAYVAAAAASALVLFLISLPVFSSEHLTPLFLAATGAGRLVGQVAAAAVALVLVRLLHRAGVRSRGPRAHARPTPERPRAAGE